MILGELNALTIARETSIGLFLVDENENEVLLPKRFMPDEFEVGATLEVFVYNDSEGRVVCTTQKPLITVNSFALLRCRDVTDIGAFMDMGIMKDVFVPKKNQNELIRQGESHMIYMYEDNLTNRLVGTARIGGIVEEADDSIMPDDEVEIVIWNERDAGWGVIVDNKFQGMVYKNQTFEPLNIGERKTAYVNRVREDGKLDILMQKPGAKNIDESAKQVVDALEKRGGFLPLTDKSSPDEITALLQMSKKSFKKAIGTLYKQRIVKLEKDGVRLL
ncbi:MAG: S1-like domain-containing RNA-binding protein [Salibacteraceae bacterium]